MEQEEVKKGFICCSVDTANHGDKRVQMVVVENMDKVREFIKTNIEDIKNETKELIENGTLSIENETIKDDCYYLVLKNEKATMLDVDSCYFQLDSFEFTYGQPFNFLGIY